MAEHRNDPEEQKNKKLLVGGFLFTILVVVAVGIFLMPGRGVGYAPTQPIPFSHELHAGTRKIQCQYCHSNVEKSSHSNVPAMNVCMNCHTVVRLDSPWIQKLNDMYKKNMPIQWINVHVLPDYVYFNHQRHVQKGVACETCHGNVAGMAKVEQVNPLTMGWCVNCHRQPQHNAPLNCNTCHR